MLYNDSNFHGYDLLKDLLSQDSNFSKVVKENLENGKIRFFDEREWDKIRNQNFHTPDNAIRNFYDLFALGYNIGSCVFTSRTLSYSYNDVDIVTGILPVLKGTKNAEEEGGHGWLERDDEIIDTSLLLVIDKTLKKDLGYIEEYRLTQFDLNRNPRYQSRKEYVNDLSLRPKKSNK